MHLHNPGQPKSLFYVVVVVHRLDDGSTETLDVRYFSQLSSQIDLSQLPCVLTAITHMFKLWTFSSQSIVRVAQNRTDPTRESWPTDSTSGNCNFLTKSRRERRMGRLTRHFGRACYISRTSTLLALAYRMLSSIDSRNYYILLFRPKAILDSTPEGVERDARARAAADSIIRLAEDTLAAGMIDCGNVHAVLSLFGALAMQTIVICSPDNIQRQLAQNKSRQCLLAFGELAKHWPVSMWIGKSFIDLLTRLTDHVREDSLMKVSSRIERATTIQVIGSRGQGHSGACDGMSFAQCDNSTPLPHPSAVTSTFDSMLWRITSRTRWGLFSFLKMVSGRLHLLLLRFRL
ncbi:hypothetical protein PMIN04_007958 [Paraphaeosphaeria minitans]